MQTVPSTVFPIPSAAIGAAIGYLGEAQTAVGAVTNTDDSGNSSGMTQEQADLQKAIGEQITALQALQARASALGL